MYKEKVTEIGQGHVSSINPMWWLCMYKRKINMKLILYNNEPIKAHLLGTWALSVSTYLWLVSLQRCRLRLGIPWYSSIARGEITSHNLPLFFKSNLYRFFDCAYC